jgi:hypothetical protein
MSRKKLAYVLKIVAVDALMFVGVIGVLLDVASHAESQPPHPMFSPLSFVGVLVFAAGFVARSCLRPPTGR